MEVWAMSHKEVRNFDEINMKKKQLALLFLQFVHFNANIYIRQSDFSVSHLSILKELRCLCLLIF
jgi:hypothetical protein